ncbi:MAG TPA: RloB family protein [Xanthobacteraceae bacterium]|nr:RloB family protein [Xanthobacteraceae bacterium]
MSKRKHPYPPLLNRRAASRNAKIKITVICEGKVTEPEYLLSLAQHCGALLEIMLIVERGAGVPITVVRKAIELKSQLRTGNSFEENDKIWVAFDRDEHPNILRALNEAEAAGVFVAYSNPCFELWLVLHYRDHDAPATRREIQRALRNLMPGYDPNRSKQVMFDQICDAVEQAENRAETLERRRQAERSPRGNPSTTVFKLTREIRRHGKK